MNTEHQAQEEAPQAGCPKMPHIELDHDSLDKAYPSLQAPDELELDDLVPLERDGLYNAGMAVVQEILNEMAISGRTRHASETGETSQ